MKTLKEHLDNQLAKNVITEDQYERKVERIVDKLSNYLGEYSDRDGNHYGRVYVNTYFYDFPNKIDRNDVKEKINKASEYGLYDTLGDDFVLLVWLTQDRKTVMVDIVEKDLAEYIEDGSPHASARQYTKAHEKDAFIDAPGMY